MPQNGFIIRSIILHLKAYQYAINNKKFQRDLDYLLGQTIRQYNIDSKQIHVSQAAFAYWNNLTSGQDIFKFAYRDEVVCNGNSVPNTYGKYVGSSKTPQPTPLVQGQSVLYNDIFHDDHVTPVSLIRDELKGLKVITIPGVKKILDEMHICKMLKSENCSIPSTKGRTLHYQDNVQNIYIPGGIIV